MDARQSKGSHHDPLTEDEGRLLRIYGRLPHGGGLPGKQSKKRAYFDSGDFAVSSADRMTDNGNVKTGTAHPQRQSISQPYAPVPNTSNINKDANKDIRAKSSPEEAAKSSLRLQPDTYGCRRIMKEDISSG